MKPNLPNTEFGSKTFVKLPGLGIVGRFVTQTQGSGGSNEAFLSQSSTTQQFDETSIRNIAEEVFKSTTPSMIGDQFKLPEVPDQNRIYVLASVNGELKWLETESCQQ